MLTQSRCLVEMALNATNYATLLPIPRVAVRRLPRRKVVWQLSPLTPSAYYI